jgi:branched-chain amino acid transport system permease protein
MFFFGIAVALLIFNPLSRMSSNLFAIIGTVILGRIITECIRLIWGPLPFSLNHFLKGIFRTGNFIISKAYVVIIVICTLVALLLHLFFKFSKAGKAMRAVANNKTAAALMGVNVPMNIAFTVGLSALLCSMIGILVIPMFNVDMSMSSMIGLKGFSAGVIGGFGSLSGAILGGLLMGVVENIGSMIFPSIYKDCISFVLLIGFLLLKPSGLLGKKL